LTVAYRYGPRLLLVDTRRGDVTPLRSAADVRRRLGGPEVGWPPGCDEGMPNLGVPIFPADRLYAEHLAGEFP
jgi:hypothetical protein